MFANAERTEALTRAGPSGHAQIGAEDRQWDSLAEELIGLIAGFLNPTPWPSEPLIDSGKYQFAESSVGAAHWVQLSSSVSAMAPWHSTLKNNRRSHMETVACCRVIESKDEGLYDWPLQVLRLRADKSQRPGSKSLSPALLGKPIARHTLRSAYWAVAKEVHPDRLQIAIATQAMTVLNEAYRQAQLYFGEREADSVIRLDQLGLEHTV